jgi:plasmid stability protein
MASILIRNLDDGLKARLRVQAARNGRSMETEAREILKDGLSAERVPGPNLADSIRRHFASVKGIELRLLPRELTRKPPTIGR